MSKSQQVLTKAGFPLLYLGAIAAAELITALVSFTGGIVFHIFLLFSLILHSSLAGEHPAHKLYLALALAPLIRILSLSMPLADIPRVFWYLIIAAPLLTGTFLAARRLGFGLREVGFSWGRIHIQLLIGLTGFLFGFMEYYILKKPEPLAGSLALRQVLPAAFILMVATGFTEELVFRGVMQRSAMEVVGRWGWVYIAFLFAVLHIGYLSVLDFFFVLGVGLFFGWAVLKTDSLFGVSLSHGITNIVLYLILPFLL